MTKISLSVSSGSNRKVKARAKKARDGGNVVLLPQESVDWNAQGNEVFRVTFCDLAKDDEAADKWIFPFEGPDDGPHGPKNAPSLKVDSPSRLRTLKAGIPTDIKYEVDCISTPSADPLDPMIIIRPPVVSDSVALGVTCGVLGAIAGAAACALMS